MPGLIYGVTYNGVGFSRRSTSFPREMLEQSPLLLVAQTTDTASTPGTR